MKERNYNILILVLAVIVLVLGYVIYKDISYDLASDKGGVADDIESPVDNDETPNDDISNGPLSGAPDISGDYTLEPNVQPTILVPDLRRPIVVLAEISPETEKLSRDKIASLTKDLELDNKLFGTWLELASYRKLIGDYLGAIEIWEFMTKVWPDSGIVYDSLGTLYHYELRDFPKSETNFRKAIEKDLTYIPTYINLYELYTLSYEKKSDLADDILIEGLLNNPGNIALLSTLAEHFTDLGDIDMARDYYNQALKEAQLIGDAGLVLQIEARINILDGN